MDTNHSTSHAIDNEESETQLLIAQLWEMINFLQDMNLTQSHAASYQREVSKDQQATTNTMKTTISTQTQQIARQAAKIEQSEERTRFYLEALRDVSAIRDVQEDKLDSKTEELQKLSTRIDDAYILMQNMSKNLTMQAQELRESKKTIRNLQNRSKQVERRESNCRTATRGLRAELAYYRRQRTAADSKTEASSTTTTNIRSEDLYDKMMQLGEDYLAERLLISSLSLARLGVAEHEWAFEVLKTEQKGQSDDGMLKRFIERATAAGIRASKP